MNIGKRLKAYREYHQLTQEDLATKAGVNEKYYGRIERNESCPTVDKLEKICTALGIELSELFLYHTRHDGRVFWLDQRIANATVRGLQNDIDIHFNRSALLDGCDNCLWYNGYICSMSFDEFELCIYAVGNIKGTLYIAYFSLANLLVDKDELSSLCESMGIPYTGSTRLSLGDAFRSATGDIRERVPVTVDGETNIYLAYCRDNKRTAGIFSRELVKETLNRETNRYEKLANISCGKSDGMFRCDNLVLDDAVDVQGCCRKAEELFELYQRCANRKQIETICVNFLRGMEATKLSVTGHMYFVPRTFMERVDIFEDFITLLSGLNKKQTPLVINSFYIIDDAKQRDKMTEEFYLAVKKEIAAYQEKCDYVVLSTKVQGGMSGSSTLVTLRAPDGKQIPAFARGARPELSTGTVLSNVKLTMRQQDTVAFYVLESYEIVPQEDRAA